MPVGTRLRPVANGLFTGPYRLPPVLAVAKQPLQPCPVAFEETTDVHADR